MIAVAFAGRGRKCLGCAYAAVCWSQEPCKSCDGESKFSVPGDFSQGKLPAKSDCPLPRIGSKEWGWAEDVCRDWHSALTEQVVVGDEFDSYYAVVLRGCKRADAIDTCSEAKRIAELLARRDWRRENGDKK